MTEYILYAAPDDDQGVTDAKEYARKYQLTPETTRIYKSEGQVKVAVHKIPPSLEETRLWNWLKVGLDS